MSISSSEAESVKARFEERGQGAVFRFWDQLDAAGRERLAAMADGIDLDELERLVDTLVRGDGDVGPDLSEIRPAPYTPLPEGEEETRRWRTMSEQGEDALRAGRVAAFTVAGGQGTRLGFDGPKGSFPVTPVREASLFQLFAEKIRASRQRYGAPIPWLIMTSHANDEATRAFFKDHEYFGLPAADLFFFTQGRMPAVDFEGNILLEATDAVALSPDGHGGSLRALVRSGATRFLADRGIDTISYFQVDNPLVRVIDPAFVGFHLEAGSDMSSKAVKKTDPGEKVGHFCLQADDRLCVIEYSDMPDEMAQERDENSEALRYRAGSIAIHLLDREFVERIGRGDDPRYRLPFHRAEKKIAVVSDSGETTRPQEPNGVKFEMFVFDALPFADNPVVIETAREEDFSPVKNATGSDSPQTSRDDQLRQWTRWLRSAGVPVDADDSGLPTFSFEITPLFADSADALADRIDRMEGPPVPADGTVFDDSDLL